MPAVLVFFSLGQIAAGLMFLLAAIVVFSFPTGCVTTAPLLQSSESGQTVYFDLAALLSRFGTPCTEAASVLPPHTDFIAPFIADTERRRADRAEADPTYRQRIDPTLNHNRINFLFYGYGETYEPPYPPDYKGSINIFSLDLATLSVATITLNHDIRAPEVERYRQLTDRRQGPTRIDQSYPVGGFNVMRLSVEDATGLSIDYQLAMSDGVIRDAIDNLFGGVDVDVPFDFDAMPIYYGGVRHAARHYDSGRQKMDGLTALQFIKAINGGTYSAEKELTVRKQIIVKAVMEATKQNAANPLFWSRAAALVRNQIERNALVLDFDPTDLLLRSLGSTLSGSLQGDLRMPSIGQSVYVVDERSGDGGVEWVTGSLNPIVQNDLRNGVYADVSFSIPKDGADPYAPDLVDKYWPSVRTLIKQRLLAQ